ncbi:MAG: hypothetical protein U0637_13575 [Phycisphaerales bacterium]
MKTGQHRVEGPEAADRSADGRPFLMVTFRCRVGVVYQRVYRSADGQRYVARCPRCGRSVRFVVGQGGTGARAFVVECS